MKLYKWASDHLEAVALCWFAIWAAMVVLHTVGNHEENRAIFGALLMSLFLVPLSLWGILEWLKNRHEWKEWMHKGKAAYELDMAIRRAEHDAKVAVKAQEALAEALRNNVPENELQWRIHDVSFAVRTSELRAAQLRSVLSRMKLI